jgi:hypothetical protein
MIAPPRESNTIDAPKAKAVARVLRASDKVVGRVQGTGFRSKG